MQFRDEKPEELMCQDGLVFRLNSPYIEDEYFILSHISLYRVALIGLATGKRWREVVPVEKVRAISYDEWKQIVGERNLHRFHLIGKASEHLTVIHEEN